ncbi:CAP domain-containing protein [Streptomyces harbinensis]|uniref:CAP domain-containing protein n=1 Tax=Streptomyces harbinensis TaxID=1176198 RepID=UPI00371F47B2
MGRHRRSVHTPAPLPAPRDGDGHRGAHRRKSPARAGLLGASAALTVGAIAVGSGLMPGMADRFTLTDTDDLQARPGPSEDRLVVGSPSASPSLERGGAAAEDREEAASRGQDRTATPKPSPSPEATDSEPEADPEPSEEPSAEAPAEEPSPSASAEPSAPEPSAEAPKPAPSTPAPEPEPSPSQDAADAAADAVLRLVNQERAQAGCRPLVRDAALAGLATDFSRDMAQRGFFSHTDPDGRSPWDRAQAAGITNMGGENIARGQQDAQAVMDAWMNSEGHRANILNCDFTTLGVGVHLGDGGPWWTQAFGY